MMNGGLRTELGKLTNLQHLSIETRMLDTPTTFSLGGCSPDGSSHVRTNLAPFCDFMAAPGQFASLSARGQTCGVRQDGSIT